MGKKMLKKNNVSNILYIFIFGVLVLWSVIPLLRSSLPMDTQEALIWGKYCIFGTTKHPPFSGWLAYPFYTLLNKTDFSMYFLSQLCVACGIIYIYKLAKCFLNEQKAVFAALLQYGIIYYHFSAVEYNVNVVSIALWPMAAYYFWQAYNENKWKDWLLFAACVGINLLNKYVSVMMLISLAIFILADKGIIKQLKNTKVYIAGLLVLLIIAPHIYWLWQHDFVSWNYIASRSSSGKINSVWRHLIYPTKFVFAQILFAAPALITYFVIYMKNKHYNNEITQTKDKRKSLFIAITAVAPVLIFAFVSLCSGSALKSMWGFPCLYMWGIALFYFLPLDWQKTQKQLFIGFMCVWISLFSIAYILQCLLTTSPRFTTNVREFTANMENIWNKKFNTQPLKYVGSDVWYADMVSLYAAHEVKPMIWLSPRNNPWFDEKDFLSSGALLIASDENEYEAYKNKYGARITPPQRKIIEFKNYFGKIKKKEILYGFLLPQEFGSNEKK